MGQTEDIRDGATHAATLRVVLIHVLPQLRWRTITMIAVSGKLSQYILAAGSVRARYLYEKARLLEMGLQQLPLCRIQTSDVPLGAVYFELVYQLKLGAYTSRKL